ncbi:MAG: amidohydrolase family protein [Pseudomonadota bacterium]|nr:amidohydrolase family protein [Pseudomonadota bacterium]
MRRVLLAAFLTACSAAALAAPVSKDQLLKPPADAAHYVVASQAGKHGDQWVWTLPDGSIAGRYSQSLRGWITEVDDVIKLGPDGLPTAITVRGVTPNGDAAETFAVRDGKAVWKASADSGEVAAAKAFYLATGGSIAANIPLTAELIKAGSAGLALFPSGRASLEKGPTLEIKGPNGPKTVQLAWVRGIGPSPAPVWLDSDGKFFAQVSFISTLPAGYEGNIKVMNDFQDVETAKAVRAIAHQFRNGAAKAPVLFDNVRLFDADKGVFVENQAVLSGDGKIKAIVPAGSMTPPPNVRVIDGRGKTLVPGLWDSHLHIGDDWSVLANLATGITSFRSPGTDIDRAVDATKRWKSGDLLMGEPFVAQIIDQKHPLAAQGAEVVTSAEEAIAAVRKMKAAGLWGVKFYTSMNPAWIAPAAAEAHRLGLQVLGHVPATMRPLDAIKAGYDEITHINFVAMQAMPDEVVNKANTAQRIEGPAKYFKDVDLEGPVMKGFIDELVKRKTVIDPTLVVWEAAMISDGGVPADAYAPYMGLLSPTYDRFFKAAGYPVVEGYTRDDYRKSYAKLVELVGAMHKAGVTIVAGTDGQGIELVREVELYKKAGMTNAEALQTATIIPARRVGVADRTGSIAVGKEADMVLVDGDVSSDLGALRRVVTVVSDGYVMDGDALRKAAGFTGRPK